MLSRPGGQLRLQPLLREQEGPGRHSQPQRLRPGGWLPLPLGDQVRQAQAGQDGPGGLEGHRQRGRLHPDAEDGEVPVSVESNEMRDD